MKTTKYAFNQDVPVIASADVVVIGGGPGGLGAAVMAARQGVRVLLVERYGYLGGMAVSGEVHPFMANHANSQTLDKPVYTEWIERMHAYLPPAAREAEMVTGEATNWRERMISRITPCWPWRISARRAWSCCSTARWSVLSAKIV